MNFIYIDESGDIGGKSRFIVFAAIITEHDRKLEKLVKKTWRAKPQYHKKGRLHAVDVDDATRIRLLSKIAELNTPIKVHYYEKKHGISTQLQQYYTELAVFIEKCGQAHTIVVERKDTIRKRQDMIDRLGLSDIFSDVIFGDPHEYKQLQAVDFVAWAFGRKVEQHDDTFSSILDELHD